MAAHHERLALLGGGPVREIGESLVAREAQALVAAVARRVEGHVNLVETAL